VRGTRSSRRDCSVPGSGLGAGRQLQRRGRRVACAAGADARLGPAGAALQTGLACSQHRAGRLRGLGERGASGRAVRLLRARWVARSACARATGAGRARLAAGWRDAEKAVRERRERGRGSTGERRRLASAGWERARVVRF
jgi:hypothetical protein